MNTETLRLSATDGYTLSATHFPASEGAVRLVVAGATGVPQGFYRRMAAFLSDQGHPVVTFDYRGIGRSRNGKLRGFQATFTDWAQLDLEAVLNWSLERGPTVVVGHSFGGQAFGFLRRSNETRGLYAFGLGTGWHGHMPLWEQFRALALWNVLGPVTTRTLGYLPARYFGLGEDLPLGVYQQWKRWCQYPRYFLDDAEFAFKERFMAVHVPIVAVSAVDDALAPPVSRDVLLTGYQNAPITRIDVALNAGPLGHMGYFRSGPGERLWEALLKWLRTRGTHAENAPTPPGKTPHP